MSIFNNVRNPPKLIELDLLFALKYGKPNLNDFKSVEEWLNRIPDAVIDQAHLSLSGRVGIKSTYHDKREYLLFGHNSGSTYKVVMERLIEYHTLLG